MKYPDWYYQTSPDYIGIDEKVLELVYLLRNNGWNTVGSSGEYEGLVIIACYDEQSGGFIEHGGNLNCLGGFLWEHGYEHWKADEHQVSWHGKLVGRYIVLKILGPEWHHVMTGP